MTRYLFRVRYTLDGLHGLLAEGGTKRQAVAQEAIAKLGGTLEGFYFAFGGTDLFIIADLPDNISAAAVSLLTSATGTTTGETTVLLTAEDIDEVTKRRVDYRAPGGTAAEPASGS